MSSPCALSNHGLAGCAVLGVALIFVLMYLSHVHKYSTDGDPLHDQLDVVSGAAGQTIGQTIGRLTGKGSQGKGSTAAGTGAAAAAGGSHAHIPLVVLKLPRSGSSWFTDTLNSHQSIFLSKEIVQRSDLGSPSSSNDANSNSNSNSSNSDADGGDGDGDGPSRIEKGAEMLSNLLGSRRSSPARTHFSPLEVENHLIAALKAPTGKIKTTGQLLPSGRFVEDYLLHSGLKPFRDLTLVGFTINPEHVLEVNWTRVVEAVPRLQVVVLLRSNVIKSAVSGYTGKETKKRAGCGSSNVRSGTDCTPVTQVPWDVTTLGREVSVWQDRYALLENTIAANAVLKSRVAYRMFYEDLQLDQEGSLRGMFVALGLPGADAGKMAAEIGLSSSSNAASSWTKRSPEDLRSALPAYSQIEKLFEQGGCACLLQQLQSAEPKVFSAQGQGQGQEPAGPGVGCGEVWDDATHKCRQRTQR